MSVKVLVAYATLALIIFGIVAQAVHVSVNYVRDNTIPIGESTTVVEAVSVGESTTVVEAVSVGDAHSLHAVVEAVSVGDAHSLHAVVELGYGELIIHGGASELLEAKYTTNITSSLPTSNYSVTDGTGLLQIHHSEDNEEFEGFPDFSRISEYQSQWDLAISDHVPLDLALIVGKGMGDIDLRGLNLTALTVDMGQGDATVDLRGEWREDASVDISAGMGHVTVLLPSDAGAVVYADRGIGEVEAKGLTQNGNEYANDAYGTSDVTLTVDVSVGVGGAEITVSD